MKVEILEQKGHKFLWINDYLWMWDIPVEQMLQKKIANEDTQNRVNKLAAAASKFISVFRFSLIWTTHDIS